METITDHSGMLPRGKCPESGVQGSKLGGIGDWGALSDGLWGFWSLFGVIWSYLDGKKRVPGFVRLGATGGRRHFQDFPSGCGEALVLFGVAVAKTATLRSWRLFAVFCVEYFSGDERKE